MLLQYDVIKLLEGLAELILQLFEFIICQDIGCWLRIEKADPFIHLHKSVVCTWQIGIVLKSLLYISYMRSNIIYTPIVERKNIICSDAHRCYLEDQIGRAHV